MKAYKITARRCDCEGRYNGEELIGYAVANAVDRMIAEFRTEHQVECWWCGWCRDKDNRNQIAVDVEEIEITTE